MSPFGYELTYLFYNKKQTKTYGTVKRAVGYAFHDYANLPLLKCFLFFIVHRYISVYFL